jgi:hypothetical protein
MLRMLAVAALVVAGVPLATASPAAASGNALSVSPDGVSYGRNLPGSVFAGVRIVPGATATRTFYVRNDSPEPGNLAVALSGVTGTDSALLTALTLRAVTASRSGAVTRFTAADPCVSLVSGIRLAAGAALRVDLELGLAATLHDRVAQGSIGGFRVPVTLTSTDVAAPDGCTTGTTPVPPHHGGDPTGTTPPGSNPPGTIGTVELSGAADGSVPIPATEPGPLAGLGGNGAVGQTAIEPNTGRFWQEYDVAGYLLAVVLGGVVAWRRRRKDLEQEAYA